MTIIHQEDCMTITVKIGRRVVSIYAHPEIKGDPNTTWRVVLSSELASCLGMNINIGHRHIIQKKRRIIRNHGFRSFDEIVEYAKRFDFDGYGDINEVCAVNTLF